MKKKVSVCLSIVMLLSVIFCMSGTKIYDETLFFAEQVASKFFRYENEKNKRLVYSKYIKGVDGANDYILVEQQGKGYAIFSKEDMQLIEYSDECVSPYSNAKEELYFAGPGNYYKSVNDKMTNINTGVVIEESELTAVATGLKEKVALVKTDVVEKETELQVIDNGLTTTENQAGAELQATIGNEEDIYDISQFAVKNRKLIDGYGFFYDVSLQADNIGGGTCATVATHTLLSFNNWYYDARLITEPDFLCRYNNGVLDGSLFPYDIEYMYATSVVNENDGKTTLYEQLLQYIDPELDGASVDDNHKGISQYLATYVDPSITVSINFGYSFNAAYAQQKALEEVEEDRPVIVAIEFVRSNKSVRHQVVAYGYQTFTINGVDQFGFITDFGWGNGYQARWFNSTWVDRYFFMSTSHQHNFTPVGNQSHIVKFDKETGGCGALLTTDEHIDVHYEKFKEEDSKYGSSHIKVCSCGYKITEQHNFTYINVGLPLTHDTKCLYCNYTGSSEHFFKRDDRCWYCGYMHN